MPEAVCLPGKPCLLSHIHWLLCRIASNGFVWLGVVTLPLIPEFGRERQVDHCEFQANLVYI